MPKMTITLNPEALREIFGKNLTPDEEDELFKYLSPIVEKLISIEIEQLHLIHGKFWKDKWEGFVSYPAKPRPPGF